MRRWKAAAAVREQNTSLALFAPTAAAASYELRVVDVDGFDSAMEAAASAQHAKATRRTTLPQSSVSVEACREAVSELFNWSGGATIESDAAVPIESSHQLRRLLEDWEAEDELRRRDAVECHLEMARTMLLSQRTDLHIRGCHSMWELACLPEHHSAFDEGSYELLLEAIRSEDVCVRSIACATLWALAEVRSTLEKLPVAARFVRALLTLICGAEEASANRKEEAASAAADEVEAISGAAAPAAAQSFRGSKSGGGSKGNGSSSGGLLAERHDTLELQIYAARAKDETGRTPADLRTWPAGALHALLASPLGMRALHDSRGEERLVNLLKDADAPFKRALVAIFTRIVSNSASAGLTLLSAGARPLVR